MMATMIQESLHVIHVCIAVLPVWVLQVTVHSVHPQELRHHLEEVRSYMLARASQAIMIRVP
jgi:hypothetical protein